MNWRVISAIAEKDIRESFKNLYVLFALIMPIGISLLFRLVMPGDVSATSEMVIAVQQNGTSSFVQNLEQVQDVRLVPAGNGVSLADAMKNNDAVGGVVIPAGLDDTIKAGGLPEIPVYINSGHGGGEVAVFQSIIRDQAWAISGQQMPVRFTFTSIADTTSPAGGAPSDPMAQLGSYFLLLALVMALAMTGMFAVPYVLAEEKEKGTLKALLVSPAGEGEVAIGKAAMGMIFCIVISGILLVFNNGLAGNWPVTILVVVLGSLFMVGAGLLLGTVFSTMSQVNTWSSIAMLAMLVPTMLMPNMVAGMTPPAIVDTVIRVIPSYYIVHPLQLSLAGTATVGDIWLDIVVLAAATAAVFAAIIWRLRTSED
jgi:ABC-2 type transport system permease protein